MPRNVSLTRGAYGTLEYGSGQVNVSIEGSRL